MDGVEKQQQQQEEEEKDPIISREEADFADYVNSIKSQEFYDINSNNKYNGVNYVRILNEMKPAVTDKEKESKFFVTKAAKKYYYAQKVYIYIHL